MPVLSRTQKFADLREKMANDAEQSLLTKELSQYENKLNNLENIANPAAQQINASSVQQNYYQQPVYTQQVAPQPIQEPVNVAPTQQVSSSKFDDYLSQLMPNTSTQVNEEPVAPVVQEPVVQPIRTNADTSADFFKDLNSMFDDIMGNANHNQTQTVNQQPAVQQPVYQQPAVQQPVQQPENTVQPVFQEAEFDINSILDKTIKEVNSYNANDGQQTIDSLTKNLVDEVVHAEEKPVIQPVKQVQPVVQDTVVIEQPVVNQAPVQEPVVINQPQAEPVYEAPAEVNDEEFSNTVSMEIDKIIDDLAYVENKVNDVKPAQEEVEAEPVAQTIVKDVKPDDGIEIKNIKELEASDTMSNTIPFIIDKESEEDEDEEEGSNIILNVILIVLIIVLIAVLGLIVYYILKTKGIL